MNKKKNILIFIKLDVIRKKKKKKKKKLCKLIKKLHKYLNDI